MLTVHTGFGGTDAQSIRSAVRGLDGGTSFDQSYFISFFSQHNWIQIRIRKPSIANLRAIVSALPRRYRRFRGRTKRSPLAAIRLLARSLRRSSQLFMGAAWCSQAKLAKSGRPRFAVMPQAKHQIGHTGLVDRLWSGRHRPTACVVATLEACRCSLGTNLLLSCFCLIRRGARNVAQLR